MNQDRLKALKKEKRNTSISFLILVIFLAFFSYILYFCIMKMSPEVLLKRVNINEPESFIILLVFGFPLLLIINNLFILYKSYFESKKEYGLDYMIYYAQEQSHIFKDISFKSQKDLLYESQKIEIKKEEEPLTDLFSIVKNKVETKIEEHKDENDIIEEIKQDVLKSELFPINEITPLGRLEYAYKETKVSIIEIQTYHLEHKSDGKNGTKTEKIMHNDGLFIKIPLNKNFHSMKVFETPKKRDLEKIKHSENENYVEINKKPLGLRKELMVRAVNKLEAERLLTGDIINCLNDSNYIKEFSIKDGHLYVMLNKMAYNITSKNSFLFPYNEKEENENAKAMFKKLKNRLDKELNPIIDILI
jgi:hypothetical protein